MKTEERALRLIRSSSYGDFDRGLDWGQWCRDVAHAGLENDEEKLDQLAALNPTALNYVNHH